MTGAELIAQTLHHYGVSHVFFVEAVARKTLVELEALGVKRVSAHAEKAAAYMADGYARVSGRPGIALAQSVGAANLAAGLKDPFLGCSPVIALTGRKPPLAQHRNAYQEILHLPMFESVTQVQRGHRRFGPSPLPAAPGLPRRGEWHPRPRPSGPVGRPGRDHRQRPGRCGGAVRPGLRLLSAFPARAPARACGPGGRAYR